MVGYDEHNKVSGDILGSPVKVRNTGLRYTMIALSACVIGFMMACLVEQESRIEELQKERLEIEKQRLEVQKKQYILDSLRFEHENKSR